MNKLGKLVKNPLTFYPIYFTELNVQVSGLKSVNSSLLFTLTIFTKSPLCHIYFLLSALPS